MNYRKTRLLINFQNTLLATLVAAMLGCTVTIFPVQEQPRQSQSLSLAKDTVPPLTAPAGYGFLQHGNRDTQFECPDIPTPFTQALEFRSKYEGSDKSRDQLNPKALASYKSETATINAFEKGISSQIDTFFASGNEQALRCTLSWLTAWANADALTGEALNHTGKSMRKWALGSMTGSYLKLKFSATRPLAEFPGQATAIENWFARLAELTVQDWDNAPLEKMNNHEYWAAWSVMASAIILDRRDLYDWSVKQYRIFATQVDKDGYLPNELARKSRALAYHNYSLPPLTMMAALAKANGDNLVTEGDYALVRLAELVQAGLKDPTLFERKSGTVQTVEDMNSDSKFVWLEPLCANYSCNEAMQKWLLDARPLKAYRVGGNVTSVFGK
ncbi:MAG: mannuronate-specific alginate lyase [Hahellaceae bacterium]|nr:mannuronate-specific alginate lyase [Hahellaceae bacterium]MCP5168317.1 mannuronate-specific alginate lyase [Hahellaceae bacterium]